MWSARSSAVTGEMVIERTDGGRLRLLAQPLPRLSRMSCSVTRTLPRTRSTFDRRRPTSSLQRMPESTAR